MQMQAKVWVILAFWKHSVCNTELIGHFYAQEMIKTLHLADCATVTNTDPGETNRGRKRHCYSY